MSEAFMGLCTATVCGFWSMGSFTFHGSTR